MSNDSGEILIREILVALDSSSHSRAALEAAATLARTLEADIHGLFVEDSNWYRISRLPSITEVNELTGDIKPLAEKNIDKQIEILENRIRRQLQMISRLNEVKHSWKTARGAVEDKVLEAAKNTDLITIGRKGHSYSKHKQLGQTAKKIIEKSDKPVLILQEGLRLGNSIVTVFDASGDSRRSIRFALSIAEKNESELFVMIIGDDQDSAKERFRELKKYLANASVKADVKLLHQSNIWEFMFAVNNHNGGLLILPRDQPFMKNRSLDLLLNHIGCPILLMGKT